MPAAVSTLSPELREVLQQLSEGLCGLYGERYRGLVLYGSYARDEATEESDVDLLLLLQGPLNPAKEIRRTGEVVWPLGLASGHLLALIPVEAATFESSTEPFIQKAREEGLRLP